MKVPTLVEIYKTKWKCRFLNEEGIDIEKNFFASREKVVPLQP